MHIQVYIGIDTSSCWEYVTQPVYRRRVRNTAVCSIGQKKIGYKGKINTIVYLPVHSHLYTYAVFKFIYKMERKKRET